MRVARFDGLDRTVRLGDGGSSVADDLPPVFFCPNGERSMHTGYDTIQRYLESGMDGRVIQSIKSFLPSRAFTGTQVGGKVRSIEGRELLGHGSSYDTISGAALVPSSPFQELPQWTHVSFLKDRDMLEFLRRVNAKSSDPEGIGALLQIVEEDLGYVMYRAVERAKRLLGSTDPAVIEAEAFAFPVRASLTREQFETAATGLLDQIRTTTTDLLGAAGLTPVGVDAVFLTGGTSLIPEVRGVFAELFGADNLRDRSTFTSLVDGLARTGALLAR